MPHGSKKRIKLFKKDNRCYWCNCLTELKTPDDNKLKDNTATLEHLLTAKVIRKYKSKKQQKIVLACYKCNQLRGDKTIREFVSCLINNAYVNKHYGKELKDSIIKFNQIRIRRKQNAV